MPSLRLQIIALNLIVLTEFTQSFVLLTANIEDIKKIARKFFSEPLAEKIVELIAKASGNFETNVSEENDENANRVQNGSDNDNELEESDKVARQLSTSKRYKKLTRRTTSTMSHNDPVEYFEPGSQENLRHKQNYQVKVPNSKIRVGSKMAIDKSISVHSGNPLVVVNKDKSMYYTKPEPEPQSKMFYWEKKTVEPQTAFSLDSPVKVKQPIWKPKKPELERPQAVHYLDLRKEKKKVKKREETYVNKKYKTKLREKPKPIHLIMEVKPRQLATEAKPRQPAIETKPIQVAIETKPRQPALEPKNIPRNVIPLSYHPKAKQHVLMNIKPPGLNGPVLKIDDFSDEVSITFKPKFTSGYAEVVDRSSLNALRQRIIPRSHIQTFALLNDEEEKPYVISPIIAKPDFSKAVKIAIQEERKPSIKIEFAGEIPPNVRADPKNVSELTTKLEKYDFDQYDLVENHTPGSVVATSGFMVLRRAPQGWWEKAMPVARAVNKA